MIIKNGKVAFPGANNFKRIDIKINDGKIAEFSSDLKDDDCIDARGVFVLPGGIDPHVHFDEPGFTDREDFYHGSCAAASGGITTVIDMPCTSIPPVINKENLLHKLNIIKRKSLIDFGLFGGISGQSYPEYKKNMQELSDYVLGFKTYFISGMESFHRLNHYQFLNILKQSGEINRPVLLHAEDLEYVNEATEIEMEKGKGWKNYYNSRPEIAELLAVQNAITLAEDTKTDLYIVHLGTAQAAGLLKDKQNISGETAPHYLEFDVDDLERIGSSLKTAPVVKSAYNKEQLWDLLRDGVINFVASDHAPAPAKHKNTGSVWTDYSGIPGTGTLLPYIFSQGFINGKLSLDRMLEVISENSAKRYGIFDRKGSIEIGKDADLVLINPDEKWTVRGEEFYSKGKITPFEGMEFQGKVIKTIVRGKVVFDSNKGIVEKAGFGSFIKSSPR